MTTAAPSPRPAPTGRLITPEEAAHLLAIPEDRLNRMRRAGHGPDYIKFGKIIRYAEPAVLQWLKGHVRTPDAGPVHTRKRIGK